MSTDKRRSRRSALLSGAAALGATALAACGAGAGDAKPAADRRPVTLQLLDPPFSDANAAFLERVFTEFQQKHPWITLNNDAQRFTLSRLSEKLTTLVVGGSAPDVSFIHPAWSTSTFNKGFFLELDERVKKDKALKVEDIFPGMLDFYRWNEKLYGLPSTTGPSQIYFNKTLFDRYGVKTPDKWEREGKWTWDTFRDVAKQLTKRDVESPVYGYAALSRDLQFYMTLPIWSYGGDVTSKDGKLSTLHAPEALAGLQSQLDLEVLHRAVPTADEDRNINKPASRPINSGRIAMEHGHRGYLPDYKSQPSLDVGVAPMPKGPKGRFARDGNAGRGVLKGSKAPDDAFLLVGYMSTWEGMGKLQLETGGGLPIRKRPFDDGSFKKMLEPWEQPFLDFHLEAAKVTRTWRLPPAGADFQTQFAAAFNAAAAGKQSLKAALDELRPRLDELLRQSI
jgi:multiple sugar transport system substrate-binding protein